jgi:hypothetical protein
MKKNETTQAQEVKETKATKTTAPKAEEVKKPETKAAATAAAPSSPEPPTPTPTATTTKKPEEKPVEQQPKLVRGASFRLSASVQIEEVSVWGMGMWAMSDGITSVCLSSFSYDKMMRVIGTSSDYKDIIKALNECMKFERFHSSARHSIERLLIKEMGGHTHTHRIRRFFI